MNTPNRAFPEAKALLPLLALPIAVAALSLQFFPAVRTPAEPSLEHEFAQLRVEIADLRREVRATAKEVSTPEAAPPGRRVESESNLSHEARIAELETRAESLDEIREALVHRAMLVPNAREVARAKSVVLDSSASPENRVEALALLHRSPTEERTRDVVLAMVELLETDPLPKFQREIFRHLRGVDDPELLQHLRAALEENDSAFVREEATRTLVGYVEDPMIQNWLRIIGEQDTNPNVRGEALNLLDETSP